MKCLLCSDAAKFASASILCLLTVISCQNPTPSGTATAGSDSLTEAQQHLPENALKGLTVFDGLEVTPFASEPMLQNPTNMDIDEKGRVWITEAYNYRPAVNGNPTNALGDRIMILEDTNGDGHADTAKVFYQGPEINAPLGIAVLGHRVIVSQSPFIWSFYDDNGDDKADRKEILFQGIGGEQHDHGAHAVSFGVDGKLYFNFGNEGHTLKDRQGKDVLDQDGEVIGLKKYQQGLLLRCNPDGSQVECLGDNFRNPYEVAVDSYGALWQSDNDDDGNRGTRINFILPYGNYGYTDEMTGASWQSSRTNMEDSIPLLHWHLNDPGEVPNLLQTGAGSPTGLLIYEGNLLPEVFHNQMIHSDAGPNVVRAYPVTRVGAGFSARIENILKGEKDHWFRPADVTVAPDGSLFVADWYDPGVGGHAAGDQVRGRVYRVAPKGAAYRVPAFDFTSVEGAVSALHNPNLSVRHHAFTTLRQMGTAAVSALEKMFGEDPNPTMKARAFWVLLGMPGAQPRQYIANAMAADNQDLRCMAIRAAIEQAHIEWVLPQAVADTSAAVRREAAIALHHSKLSEMPGWWTSLALQHDGKDRWYLEALGIGADRQWEACLGAYLKKVGDPLATAAGKDIIWRARTDISIPYLARLAADPSVPLKSRQRYFRAFDFNTGKVKYTALLGLIQQNTSQDIAFNKLALHALDLASVKRSATAQSALKAVLESVKGTAEFVELAGQYSVTAAQPELLALALQHPDEDMGVAAAGLLLKLGGKTAVQPVLLNYNKDSTASKHLLEAIARVGSGPSVDLVQELALGPGFPAVLRKLAAARIGWTGTGEQRVLALLRQHKVPQELIPAVVASVDGAWMQSVKDEAASYLPSGAVTVANIRKEPVMDVISALTPDPGKGKSIFSSTCSTCHKAGATGFDFGPNLSEIGTKLPKEALLEAIVHPSAGIGFGYEGWNIRLKDGSSFSAIIVSKTETDLEVKFPGGARKQYKTRDIESMEQMKNSMMTEGLYAHLSDQDMADLLDFLSALRKN